MSDGPAIPARPTTAPQVPPDLVGDERLAAACRAARPAGPAKAAGPSQRCGKRCHPPSFLLIKRRMQMNDGCLPPGRAP